MHQMAGRAPSPDRFVSKHFQALAGPTPAEVASPANLPCDLPIFPLQQSTPILCRQSFSFLGTARPPGLAAFAF